MEESGKRRLAAAAAVLVGIAYFLLCASPLGKQPVLAPVWARDVSSAAQAPGASPAAGAAARPFSLGGKFGYYDESGTILFAASAPYGVALSESAFATYDRLSTAFSIRSPSGKELARSGVPGYPFFAAGRRFVLAPDQCAVSELSPDGSARWTRRFGSVITAFGASPSLAVFGLMEGSIVGLDPSGEAQLDFAPGGSKLPGIYGVAVSPDGNLVGAVSGLYKQRLVVLEKRSSAYRVTYHRWLESDFRRPVAMAFTGDGERLVYEVPGGAAVYDRASRGESLIAAIPNGRVGEYLEGSRMVFLLAGDGASKRLVCVSPEDRYLVDLALRADDAFIDVRGRMIFLGADSGIVRLDLREE